MKNLSPLFFILGLMFSACGTAATQPVLPAQTSTPTKLPTATQTPVPPSPTITPLPTIPTFTPTFDVSTIVTVTPAEMVEYPNKSLNSFSETITKELLASDAPKIMDLTNDGFPEVVVVGKSTGGIAFGEISIYSCQNNSYSVVDKVPGLFDIPKLFRLTEIDLQLAG